MNIVDRILNKIITRFLTKDEWHTVLIGFSDGFSFTMQGKWNRKAFGNPKINIEGIETEKAWYYRIPYIFGELTKLGLIIFLVERYGFSVLLAVI